MPQPPMLVFPPYPALLWQLSPDACCKWHRMWGRLIVQSDTPYTLCPFCGQYRRMMPYGVGQIAGGGPTT